MVLSQSCDLVDGDINGVLLARFQSWSSILKSRLDSGETTGKSHKQSLRKNRISGQIVIPPSSEILDHEWSVIDFHSLYTLPLPYLEEFAASLTRRLRVEAPYRQGIVGAFSGWLGRPEYLDELADFDDIA
jgi:hypothetical protein